MYSIFTYISLIFMVNVGKYTIHGSYGFMNRISTCDLGYDLPTGIAFHGARVASLFAGHQAGFGVMLTQRKRCGVVEELLVIF